MIKAASKRVVGRLIGLMRQKEHETLPTFFMNFDLFISPPPKKRRGVKKKIFVRRVLYDSTYLLP